MSWWRKTSKVFYVKDVSLVAMDLYVYLVQYVQHMIHLRFAKTTITTKQMYTTRNYVPKHQLYAVTILIAIAITVEENVFLDS